MLVTYTGKKTAYYNNQSYWPGEVYEADDEIPLRDGHGQPKLDKDGNAMTVPLKVYPENPHSKLRKATKEEVDEYIRKNPRYARRLESEAVASKQDIRSDLGRSKRKPVTVGEMK